MATNWDNFYVIVGSAAGALVGLQFVVLTLIAERPVPHFAEGTAAFTTPTVIHFMVVLLISALACIPWPSHAPLAACWFVIGLFGVGYVAVVVQRIRTQPVYRPETSDWVMHVGAPLLAHGALIASSVAAWAQWEHAHYGVAFVTLSLLFTGLYNTWDSVTYHVVNVRGRKKD